MMIWWCVSYSSHVFCFYSKRCMKSSWRTATCTWNTEVVSLYSLFLQIRKAEHPQPLSLHETAVASPLGLFLRLVPQTQAIRNIPKPYLSFSQTVSTLIAVHSGWYLIVWRGHDIIKLFQEFFLLTFQVETHHRHWTW